MIDHTQGVESLAAFHKHQGAKVIVCEPGRPRNWPKAWPWDSPDVVAFYDAHRVHADDFKRLVPDVYEQLEKPQVKRPGFAVGLYRSLCVTSQVMADLNGAVPMPSDTWGLRVVDVEGHWSTYDEPMECSERNHVAEKRILWSQIPKTAALRTDAQKAESRGLRAEIEALVKETGGVSLKEIKRTTGRKLAEIDRAIAGSVKVKAEGSPAWVAPIKKLATSERPG